MKKHKMTGCARLFIALLILAPLAYLGAAYYNGENGIENIKHLLGIGSQTGETPSNEKTDEDTYRQTSIDLRKTISEKDARIRELEKEVQQLKEENKSLKQAASGGQ